MMQFAARPTSAETLPIVSFKHSATETKERTFLDPRARESLYEKLPLRGRPLSYSEILRYWTKAVIKRQNAVESMEEAQDEYEDYASDIIAVVGQEEYDRFLASLLSTIDQYSATIRGLGDL